MTGELTGEIRYRSERSRGHERLILQVETMFSVQTMAAGDTPGMVAITKSWRDATTMDLTAPELQRAAARRFAWPPAPSLDQLVERTPARGRRLTRVHRQPPPGESPPP